METIDGLYEGDKSECCHVELIMNTDGDADWFTCEKCGEDCNGIFLKNIK